MGSNLRWQRQSVHDGGSPGIDLSFTMRTNSTLIQKKYKIGGPEESICQSIIDPGI
jgi:hypothetical protein